MEWQGKPEAIYTRVVPGHPERCHCGQCYALRRELRKQRREASYQRARFVLLNAGYGDEKD